MIINLTLRNIQFSMSEGMVMATGSLAKRRFFCSAGIVRIIWNASEIIHRESRAALRRFFITFYLRKINLTDHAITTNFLLFNYIFLYDDFFVIFVEKLLNFNTKTKRYIIN